VNLRPVLALLALAFPAGASTACSSAPGSSPAGETAEALTPSPGDTRQPPAAPDCSADWTTCGRNARVAIACDAMSWVFDEQLVVYRRVPSGWSVVYQTAVNQAPEDWMDPDTTASSSGAIEYRACTQFTHPSDSPMSCTSLSVAARPPVCCRSGFHACGDEGCVPNGKQCT
jgi:hypothetical protein